MSELTKALIEFHQQVGTIHKDAKAQYGAYADLAGVLSTVTPVLSANGLAIMQTFLEDNLITTLRHVSGEEASSVMRLVVPQGRNELHSTGASITYLRRYMICSILGIVADMDTDGVVPESPKPDLAKPAPKKTVAKKKAAPAPQPDLKSLKQEPLSKEDYEMVIDMLKGVHRENPDKLKGLTEAFRLEFPDVAELPLSQAITTQAHVAFINDQL